MVDSTLNPAAEETLTFAQALQRANEHWNAGQSAQAENLCRRILEAQAEHPGALHLLGLIAHAYGRLDEAIEHLRKAGRAFDSDPVCWSNLAEMCRQRGLLNEGETAARKAVALNPTMFSAWNNLGILLQEMGRYGESRRCLEKVHQWRPDDARVLNNLANTCLRQGDGVQAEHYWRKAIELDPGYAQPHSNLAKRLGELERYDEALHHGRQAIMLDPHMADAYLNLAALEMGRNRLPEVGRWLNALLAFRPDHANALAARALLLKQRGELSEALAVAERAVEVAPQNADCQHALGSVLQAMDRPDEALAAYKQAATLPGTKVEEALVNLAILYMEQGRQEDAEATFAQAIEQFPNSVGACYSSADLIKFKEGDPRIAGMQALYERRHELTPGENTALYFALGKMYMDIGDAARAFANFDQGNAMKRATYDYDPSTYSRLVTDIARTFDAEHLAKFNGCGAPGDLPIFIVGMPRSGTTLTEQILASHSAIKGAGELSHLDRIVSASGGYPQNAATASRAMLRSWGQEYLDRVQLLADDARYIIDKMPSNFMFAGLIRLILPNARIIHCRRDAVDTCLSCYTKLFGGEQPFSYDQRELGRFYRDYETLMAHWRTVLPATHFLEVDYEALVEDQEGQTRRMLTFLGLDWEPACREFHTTARLVRTASFNQVRRPIYKTAVGRWKPYAKQLVPLLEALGRHEPAA